MITTFTTTMKPPQIARELERLVRQELCDNGMYISEQDSFDLTEMGEVLLVNGAGDVGRLPYSARLTALVAAAIHLRDPEGER